MYKTLAVACVCLAIAVACSKRESLTPKRIPEGKPLVIGLIPEEQIFDQMERYKPLADYLSQKIDVKVKLKVLAHYGDIIDDFNSEGLDGAFFGSFAYTIAHAKLGVEALARPETLDGISTYHGLIFVRKDSGIKTVKDMEGKRFAFVDKATTAGYLLPLQYFRAHGIRNYKTYLKEAYFAGTHQDAIYDVLNKKADVGAAKNTIYEKAAKKDPRITKELVVLARSPDVPENALAVRKDLDETFRRKLKDALLSMHNDPEGLKVLTAFGASRFVETTDKDYGSVVDYAKKAGIDLSSYNFE